MPIRNRTPSDYVGPQVRYFRRRRDWKQQDLVDRLHQLGMRQTGWSQTKIHKLETGKMTRVLLDDVFELAAALDVAPVYLMTPTVGVSEEGDAFKVWVGGAVSRWPRLVREWIRGERPLLALGDYASDEEAVTGARFFFFDGRPMSDWQFADDNPVVSELLRSDKLDA